MSSQREFLRDMAAILVSKAGFASDSPDVQRLRRMAEQPSLGLRLTRMANTASTVADELNDKSTRLLRQQESGHVAMAEMALIFRCLAVVLRAGTDPSDNLTEENLR